MLLHRNKKTLFHTITYTLVLLALKITELNIAYAPHIIYPVFVQSKAVAIIRSIN